ncbi:hypothetical protein HDU79_008801 [Rhizoclosmatium sp. JEL0117]|nr:hypothetical protein HDU79_008801 [Rhizoclosmatium sp. JEL0117]
MQLRLPRFFNRNRSQEAISSGNQSSNSVPLYTSSESSPSLNQPPSSSQVVVLTGDNQGLSSLVPLLTKASLASNQSPGQSPIALAAEPDSFNTASTSQFNYETYSESQSIDLMHLPNELLIKISLHAGFLSALNLMKTCSRFETLLDDPRSWSDYSLAGSSDDLVESEVTVCTKLHTFDHLVFGLWDSIDGETSVYFEHFTFNEQYDYLGGVNMGVSRTGVVRSEFFEHKETLPCYQRALVDAVAAGVLPGTAPHGDPPAGAKIDHQCVECSRYDQRRVLKSIFVFDEVPYNPRWGKEGFSWVYAYPDGRRRVKIRVTPYEGVVGYNGGGRDLPSVWIKKVNVNGKVLEQEEWELWQRLVMRRKY